MELVLVMSIIGIFAAIATPRYVGALQNYRINAAATRLQADLEFARTRAKSVSLSRTVTFDNAADHYVLVNQTTLDRSGAPYQVELDEEPYRTIISSLDLGGDGQLVIDGFGFPDADGAIILAKGSRRLAVVIDATTGEFKVEEATPTLQTVLAGKGVTVNIN